MIEFFRDKFGLIFGLAAVSAVGLTVLCGDRPATAQNRQTRPQSDRNDLHWRSVSHPELHNVRGVTIEAQCADVGSGKLYWIYTHHREEAAQQLIYVPN